MFEELKKYNKILVTGAQRSGTRIATKMIAQDTGHTFVDEAHIAVDNMEYLDAFLSSSTPFVIHAPAVFHKIHTFDIENMLVVVMRRSLDEIHASEKRIDWSKASRQLELSKYGFEVGDIAKIKYDQWETYQRNDMRVDYIEVQYKSLAEHPLWVPKKARKDFAWNDTEVKRKNG